MGDEVRRAVKKYLGKNPDVPAFRVVDPPGFDDIQATKLTGLSARRLEWLSTRALIGPAIDLSYEDASTGDYVERFRWDGVDLLHARVISDLDRDGVPALVLLTLASEFCTERDLRVADGGLEGFVEFLDLIVPTQLDLADRWVPAVVRRSTPSDLDEAPGLLAECQEAETAVAAGTAVRYPIGATARHLVAAIKAMGAAK
jgi:hypothetical protein